MVRTAEAHAALAATFSRKHLREPVDEQGTIGAGGQGCRTGYERTLCCRALGKVIEARKEMFSDPKGGAARQVHRRVGPADSLGTRHRADGLARISAATRPGRITGARGPVLFETTRESVSRCSRTTTSRFWRAASADGLPSPRIRWHRTIRLSSCSLHWQRADADTSRG